MSRSPPPARLASVEDADESDHAIEGTAKYAASAVSPKEKPNTSRTRRDSRQRDSSPFGLTDSDSTVHPVLSRRQSVRAKGKARERPSEGERQIEKISRGAVVPMRPSIRHGATTGDMRPRRESRDFRELEASYYGVNPSVQPVVTPATSRPRAQTGNPRPASYYGRPPPQANARFYAAKGPPPGALPTSYPPQPWAQTPQGVYPVMPSSVVAQPEYYARPLESRFGPSRPQSAMSHRVSRSISYEDYEPIESEKQLARRSMSQRKVVRSDMPPPPRPSSARPTTLAFRPAPAPTTPAPRRSVGFDDEDLREGSHDLFQDISPMNVAAYKNHQSPAPAARIRHRRPSVDARSVSYDMGVYHTEIAGRKSRRNSYYNDQSVSSSSAYEDKAKQAMEYQDEVSGGNMPLTAETLRKAGRNGGSSRSTRSSGSHDESEYRRSATTRTTRSSAENEDVTIRVKGLATLKVGGAEMQCQDGAEINIARGCGYRGGSDESSYLDQDDCRTRYERPVARTRASSQAESYSRGPHFPPYDPNPMVGSYDMPHSFGYPQPERFPPPYPTYPNPYARDGFI